jgi:hypothetical protein
MEIKLYSDLVTKFSSSFLLYKKTNFYLVNWSEKWTHAYIEHVSYFWGLIFFWLQASDFEHQFLKYFHLNYITPHCSKDFSTETEIIFIKVWLIRVQCFKMIKIVHIFLMLKKWCIELKGEAKKF